MEVHAGPGDGWEAVADGQVVGRAEVWRRPDDRLFLHVHDGASREARHALLRSVPPTVDGELHTWIRSGAPLSAGIGPAPSGSAAPPTYSPPL